MHHFNFTRLTVGRLTIEVLVDIVVVEWRWAKVNKPQSAGVHLNQKVLVLDVTVYHARLMHVYQDVNHLPEEPASLVLWQAATLRDVVKEVVARRRPLQHQHVVVCVLKVVKQLHDARDVWQFLQQEDLHRKRLSPVQLRPLSYSRFADVLYCHLATQIIIIIIC